MSGVLAIGGQVVAVAGAFVLLLAAAGLLRFDDVYMRASAVATATGVGISLVIIGSLLVAPGPADTVKALLAVALQLVTSALGGILLARSAILTDHPFRPDTDITALRTHPPQASTGNGGE